MWANFVLQRRALRPAHTSHIISHHYPPISRFMDFADRVGISFRTAALAIVFIYSSASGEQFVDIFGQP